MTFKILSSLVLSILLRNSDNTVLPLENNVTGRFSASVQVNRSSVTFYLKIRYNSLQLIKRYMPHK